MHMQSHISPRAAARRHAPVKPKRSRARGRLTLAVLAVLAALSPAWALDRPVPPLDPELWNCAPKKSFAVCSFAGFDLTGSNITLSPLRGFNFSNTLLPGPWSGSQPSGVRLTGAEILGGADIWLASATSIAGVQVREARLRQVSLAGRVLKGASFVGVEFDRVDFRGADLTGVNLDRRFSGRFGPEAPAPSSPSLLKDAASLAGVHFGGWRFNSGDLGARVLDGARFEGATLAPAMFVGSSLSGASFAGALNFNPALLRNAGLDAAGQALPTLQNINLTGQSLVGADLRGLDLTGATLALRGVNVYEGTVLARAKVTDAALMGQAEVLALLSSANGTRFAGMELKGAQLRNADLRQAQLAGVSLAGGVVDNSLLARSAVLDGIDLSGTSGVTTRWLNQAAGPTGLVQMRGARLERLELGDTNLRGFVLDGASFAGTVIGELRVDERTSLVGADFSSARRPAGTGLTVFDDTTLRALQPQQTGDPCRVCDAKLGPVAGTNFRKMNLSGVQMQVAGSVDFSGSDLSKADLRGSDLRQVFQATSPVLLTGIDLSTPAVPVDAQAAAGATQGVRQMILSALPAFNETLPLDLSNARLGIENYQPKTQPVNLRNLDLRRIKFTNADLSGADLTGLFSSRVIGPDLGPEDDIRSSLNGTRLVGAIGITNELLRLLALGDTSAVQSITLSDQSLPQVVGRGGTDQPPLIQAALAPTQWLKNFDLRGRSMFRWVLDRAVLDDAQLVRANLAESSLVDARLLRADLSDANLSSANLRGADLTDAKFTTRPPDGRLSDKQTEWREARFDAFTLLPTGLKPVSRGMIFVVGPNRVDQAVMSEDGDLARTEIETGGTLVISGNATVRFGYNRTAIDGNGTVLVQSGRLLQRGGTIAGRGVDGLWLLGRVEGYGSLRGRINVMDTLARGYRDSFENLWLAPTARLELRANDWRSGPLFSGNWAWLDGVLSVDFAGANLDDGDRLVLIAADTIGGRFDSTEWRGLPDGTQVTLISNPGYTQLALAVSVTAVPEPATALLAALGGLGLAAWMRRRRGRVADRDR